MEFEPKSERLTAPKKQTELFVERRHEVADLVRASFAGAPWFEELSDNEALARVESHIMKPGFEALVTMNDDKIVAGLWYDMPSLDELSAERGEELASFAQVHSLSADVNRIVWQRESVVHPDYQGRGLATQLRQELIDDLSADEVGSALLLTRMRDDNTAIISVARKFGYERNGIRIPSSQNPDTSHEYWYKIIQND